ncbi:hypothetical protein, partial [Streptococcus merionis]|uniref:hypothetical protein n=1 Tax=Streptococcus merionis TaxID=400065 RepID=UPI0035127697
MNKAMKTTTGLATVALVGTLAHNGQVFAEEVTAPTPESQVTVESQAKEVTQADVDTAKEAVDTAKGEVAEK